MCTGAEIAAITGTAAQQYDKQQTAHDQQREVERRAEEARQLNERAGARVSQEVDKLKTSTDEAGRGEETRLQNDFMEALRRSQLANGGSGLDSTPGAVSDQFADDAKAARVANVAGNRAAATNIARLDAPFMQRVREATGTSRLTSDLSRIDQQGAGQDFVSRLRASLISPNAGLQAAGDLAIGYGDSRSKRMLPVKRGATPSTANAYDTSTTYNPGGYNA